MAPPFCKVATKTKCCDYKWKVCGIELCSVYNLIYNLININGNVSTLLNIHWVHTCIIDKWLSNTLKVYSTCILGDTYCDLYSCPSEPHTGSCSCTLWQCMLWSSWHMVWSVNVRPGSMHSSLWQETPEKWIKNYTDQPSINTGHARSV